jgi:hypothetical protein
MSWQALAWAAKYRAGSASEKLVLLAYAERHSEETGCAYPSVAWLCEFSSLNRKSVIAAIGRLEVVGALADTGERQGKTRQIKVYRVNLETVPKAEQFQDRNSTAFSAKQSQNRDTDTVKEPISQKASPSSRKRARQSEYHRLPEGWEPTRPLSLETQAKVDQWPPGKLFCELENFRAWAVNAKDEDGKGRKRDWDQAWGNWLRGKHDDWAKQQPRQSSSPGIGRTAAAAISVFGPPARQTAGPEASELRRAGAGTG